MAHVSSNPRYNALSSRMTRRAFVTSAAASVLLPRPAIAQSSGVSVGVMLPLSGPIRRFGEQARIGLELAASRINAAGGLAGAPLRLDYRNDRAIPGQAATEATDLAADAATIALIGPITSASRVPVANVAEAENVPLLYATDYEGGQCGPNFFCFNSVPNQKLGPLLNHVKSIANGSIFMLGADYVWPRMMFEAASQILSRDGDAIVGRRFIPIAGLDDYSALIEDIRASDAKILILALPGDAHIAFLRQLHDHNFGTELTIAALGGAAIYAAPYEAAPGVTYQCVPFAQSDPEPSAQSFVSRVRSVSSANSPVTSYLAQHYVALAALAKTVNAAGEASRSALRAGLGAASIDGPGGRVTMNPASNHCALTMRVVKVDNGVLSTLVTTDEIQPIPQC